MTSKLSLEQKMEVARSIFDVLIPEVNPPSAGDGIEIIATVLAAILSKTADESITDEVLNHIRRSTNTIRSNKNGH